MRRSQVLTATALLVITLGVAEAVAVWHHIRTTTTQRITVLERQLLEKTAELNYLIRQRDLERRARGRTTAAVAPGLSGGSSEERELMEATLRARNDSDYLSAAQGSSPLGPGDIDPGHLVNMANMMTGKEHARMIRLDGGLAIHFATAQFPEDDPFWQIVDVAREAKALRTILLVGSAQDEAVRKKLGKELKEFGIVPGLIHLKTNEAELKAFQGTVLKLMNRGKT